MNRSDFLSVLNQKYYKVGQITPADPSPDGDNRALIDGFRLYRVNVLDLQDDNLQQQTLQFFIVDPETEREDIYWKEKAPLTRTEVATIEAAKIADAQISDDLKTIIEGQ